MCNDTANGLKVLLLNSSTKLEAGPLMGLGDLGSPQLQALSEQLTQLQTQQFKYLLVVLHHAPARRESDQWNWRQVLIRRSVKKTDMWDHTELALNFSDAQKLVEILERFARSRPEIEVLIFHGHRHGRFLGRTDEGLRVVEAPAVVELVPGFWVGDIKGSSLQIS